MTNAPFRYKNIFLYASLQFSGNIEEYFKKHTEKLVVFIVMPRINNKFNLIRHYSKGVLIKEIKVKSANNIFLYYFMWYIQYIIALQKFFAKKDKVAVISFHPISFFLMHIQKLFRKVVFVYWIGDYFPGVNVSLILYEKIKKYYHRHVSYACYLSDKINAKMNGTVAKTVRRKTIMWGVKPKNIARKKMSGKMNILFVGLIKPSQGIEDLLLFLKDHYEYRIKILGVCEQKYYSKLNKIIKTYNISTRVYFPNVFLSDEELEKESLNCHVGVALYDASPLNASFYADPGKVKSYAELGLPIIMSDISDVTRYIKKYKCGEIINSIRDLESALVKIKKHYVLYQHGLQKFNNFFYYDSYYKNLFHFLEKI
jgi:hypothetical protein